MLLVLWLTLRAFAVDVPPEMAEVVAAVEQANGGDRKGAVARLDAVLRDHPDLVDAHVVRGLNRYLLGDEAGAREDLAFSFDASAWKRSETWSDDFVEVVTETTTVDLTEQRRVGAASLVVLDARADRIAEGRATLSRAREVFGDDPRLRAAEARLLLADDQPDAAWRAMADALEVPDFTGFTASVASELLALDPTRAPPELVDALAARGQWTAVYNQARGQLMDKRYQGCADTVAEKLDTFDEPKLLALGYTCAARADATRAATWLEALGGARRADPADVVAHARTLADAGDRAAAVALLEELPKKLPDAVARNRAALLLTTLVALDRLDDAAKACDGSAPAAEAQVAHALVTAKRVPEARRILETACPAMGEESGRAACDQLLDWARSN